MKTHDHDHDCARCSRAFTNHAAGRDRRRAAATRFWTELWFLLFAGAVLVLLALATGGRL